MSQLLNVSICLTDLIEQAKKGHSAFVKVKTKNNGDKIFVNVRQWINDQEDSYGNISSFLLSSSKEKRDTEGKVYIGNAKISKLQEQVVAAITADELEINDDSLGLPF